VNSVLNALFGDRNAQALASGYMPQPRAVVDSEAVSRNVTRYAIDIGCTPSNVAAAVSWALKNGRDTFSATRDGKDRARALLQRQKEPPEPPKAA
jgi:hypothetical protein